MLEQESEAYSVDVSSGSMYVGVDMVGGKSVVWNQLISLTDVNDIEINGITFTVNKGDGTIRRNVGTVDLGTLDWTYNSEYKFMMVAVDGKRAGHKNLIISRYNLSPNDLWLQDTDGVYG